MNKYLKIILPAILVVLIGVIVFVGSKIVYAQSELNAVASILQNNDGKVVLPAGDYDFKGQTITFDKYTEIEGQGKNNTTLRNVTFFCKNGIKLENLSMQGGNECEAALLGLPSGKERIAVILNPKADGASLVYKNVSFNGFSIVSYAVGKGTISTDVADGCEFNSIGKVAIYHSINSLKSVYTNNVFMNIGGRDILSGEVAAIWLGDVTNITYAQTADATITNNTFKDLYTGDDYSESKHAMNANFIAIRANKAIINDNIVDGIHGFGEDREAIYTKVKYLHVMNNTISNGGYGEGYITCKGQDGEDAYNKIIGNVITGDYGKGIYLYGAGMIAENTVSIDNCIAGIVNFNRDCDTQYKVTIKDNVIKSEPGRYANGVLIEQAKPKGMIVTANRKSEILISGNKLETQNLENLWKIAIDVSMATKNIRVEDNEIDLGKSECIGVFVHANEKYSQENKDISVDVANNNIKSNEAGVNVILKNDDNVISHRDISITDNVKNGTGKEYSVYDAENNNDEVEYKSYRKKWLK